MAQDLLPRTTRKTRPGIHYPLGATVQDGGVNFAIYSQRAQEVLLLLFDRPEGEPTDVIRLDNRTRRVWHVFVDGVRPGQLYGYKMRGPYEPRRGLRFNEHKLLIDPYAKAVAGKFRNASNLLLGYDAASPDADLSFDPRDNTRIVPKSVVVHDHFEWQGDTPLHIPFEKLVLYEAHLRGFTAHPSSLVRSPGTYLGFVEKAAHLEALGVNAVVLLPVMESCVEDYLIEKGLTNYWGYNPIGFFAPESSFGSNASYGCQVAEFKTLVRELHKAGIEVLLDVTFRHTGEGNELGPTMSLRGIDNPTYYCLTGGAYETRRRYVGTNGSGNSLNLRNPPVTRLIMDALRYWVETMHVDGFRFDLASLMGCEQCGVGPNTPFFHALSQDPVLCHAKLIAEPWDRKMPPPASFPIDWAELNPRFRDTARRFARGDDWQTGDMGYRVTGSADLYADDGRSAFIGVNTVTSHDGFTLSDLVSYTERHNEANLEDNLDGLPDGFSWNCGAEGETRDASVQRLRRQVARNHICHLLLSLGTPMLLGGDEFLRSQHGNNNAYCQDNELSWFNWELSRRQSDFLAFVRKAIAFRRRHQVFLKRRVHPGVATGPQESPEAQWFDCELGAPDWQSPGLKTLALLLDGRETIPTQGDKLLFLILHAGAEAANVRVPEAPAGVRWYRVVDTSLGVDDDFLEPGAEIALAPEDAYLANPRSTVLLVAR